MSQASEHPFITEANRRMEALCRGRDQYKGGKKIFHHMGHEREAAYPWLSDVEMAGEVRMLVRNDPVHEAVVCAARDRILHLSEEVVRLQERERDGLRLLDAAFGEYACIVKAKLSENEVYAFERNFAEPARKFIRETRS